MITTISDVAQCTASSATKLWLIAQIPPATPASAADSIAAVSLYRAVSYPRLSARAAFSRIATSTRPNG